MTRWQQDFKELQRRGYSSQAGNLRGHYLQELHRLTGRNVLVYYSGIIWGPQIADLIRRDPAWAPQLTGRAVVRAMADRAADLLVGYDGIIFNDFQTLNLAIFNLDPSKGLDFVLHTDGGWAFAAKHIMETLRARFGPNIRVIVPERAVCAGAMLACVAATIVMGREANLWRAKSPAYVRYTQQSLETGMFVNEPDREAMAAAIAKELFNPQRPRGLPFSFDDCVNMGLHVESLESNPALQEVVASMHAALLHTLAYTPASKVIENHEGMSFVSAMPGVSSVGQAASLGVVPG